MKRMSKAVCALLLLLITNIVHGQTGGGSINFQDVSFAQALQQSGKTGRLVFIDCYTSWCAPCKWMEQNVFNNDTISGYYNQTFINLKIDMEKGEGIDLRKKYSVASFPTYLFVNEKGDIVHRTASRMDVSEFLQEGKNAIDPAISFAVLQKKYEAGERSKDFLFNYTMALQKVNRNTAQGVEQELISRVTDEDLYGPFGWQLIEKLARSEKDRLGKYFLQNREHFEVLVGPENVKTVANRLRMSTMYSLIRAKDSSDFFRSLEEMRTSTDRQTKRNVAMLEMEYYLEMNNADSFVLISKRAMNGVLEFNDMDLSFVARRALYMAKSNPAILQQSLLLARRAVVLNPEEYSNQGTLASICLELKLKQEGLLAARKARQLADASTSKIQKIAQELLDKIQNL
ncbi:MAG: thioredoxin family protein [Flavisolibacter sp.]